eukprot:scaffold8629_cov114-Isochrysis_galbana.AAC.6
MAAGGMPLSSATTRCTTVTEGSLTFSTSRRVATIAAPFGESTTDDVRSAVRRRQQLFAKAPRYSAEVKTPLRQSTTVSHYRS